MARVFLDANKVFDLIDRRSEELVDVLDRHELTISPLSVHIFLYVTKNKVPHRKLEEIMQNFSIVDFNQSICNKSFQGPTDDFEDNVQLHSAAASECDVFLTNDKKLLDMKFFGKTKIIQEISN